MFNKDFLFSQRFGRSSSACSFTPKDHSASPDISSRTAQGGLAGHDIAVSSPRLHPVGLPEKFAFRQFPRPGFRQFSLRLDQSVCSSVAEEFTPVDTNEVRNRLGVPEARHPISQIIFHEQASDEIYSGQHHERSFTQAIAEQSPTRCMPESFSRANSSELENRLASCPKALAARFADGSGNRYELDLVKGTLNKTGANGTEKVVLRDRTDRSHPVSTGRSHPVSLKGNRLNFLRIVMIVLEQERQLTGKPRIAIDELRKRVERYDAGGKYSAADITTLIREISRILACNNIANLIVRKKEDEHEPHLPGKGNKFRFLEMGNGASFIYSDRPMRKRDEKLIRKSAETNTWSDDVLRQLEQLDHEQQSDFLLHVMDLSTPYRENEDFNSYKQRVLANVRNVQAKGDQAILSALQMLEEKAPGTAADIFGAIERSDSASDQKMIEPQMIVPRGQR